MGLFSGKKFDAPDPYEASRPDGSVPDTVGGKKWNRVRDELPFPVDPSALKDQDDTMRRVNFGHQRVQRHWS